MTLSAGVSDASTQPVGRVGRAEPAQAQRAEPVGVAHAEEPLGAHEHEGERALEDRAAPACSAVERSSVSGKDWASSSATTSLSVAIDPGSIPTFSARARGVGQVAVVPEREAGPADGPVDGLGPRPVRGAVRRVAGVADGEVALRVPRACARRRRWRPGPCP